MTHEFYLRTQALHEEFQKRELHYHNTERKLRSNIMSKKELNLPFQEYLQRINEREKESEETYRNIMKQMGELDRHTDAMSLKLEKLGILQNSLASFTFPNWPSKHVESNLQVYGTTEIFKSKPEDPRFELLEHNVKSIQTNLNSVATQTENTIYCEKCHSFIHSQPRHFMGNEPSSFLNIHSEINHESQAMYLAKSQEDSFTLNKGHSNSQLMSSANGNFFTESVNIDKIGENSKMGQQINEKSPEENIHSDVKLNERYHPAENQSEFNKSLIKNAQKVIVRNEEEIIKSQHSENQNCDSKSSDPNVDIFVSKSDAESMNNEFDFLESDTRITSCETKARDISKTHKSSSSDADMSLDKETSLVVEHPSEPPLKQANVFHANSKLELGDNKSESSGSVSAPHSPNISVASDSDSSDGKESPLTASAAYQALLGNTVISKKTKRDNSDSESEDEVENALANVVQSSHEKSKSSKFNQIDKTTNDKSSSQTVDSKLVPKGSKPPSLNKPQAKLSKKTRKVLGLDTSSGSEVELVVKPPEKKIDEDSDEFDFYN